METVKEEVISYYIQLILIFKKRRKEKETTPTKKTLSTRIILNQKIEWSLSSTEICRFFTDYRAAVRQQPLESYDLPQNKKQNKKTQPSLQSTNNLQGKASCIYTGFDKHLSKCLTHVQQWRYDSLFQHLNFWNLNTTSLQISLLFTFLPTQQKEQFTSLPFTAF